ncbi:hypothetical protein ACPOL_3645 [Acidisarcina polymorpha]|uniref:Uncharacterized protein n=1 Tax=Acidisarcina polymorpha TaxID=2211140 RepID=A0A2Z5G1H1_9BACT|nr:hypothetical protein ACPOL_3645 [Acidisarcina polymorpha]
MSFDPKAGEVDPMKFLRSLQPLGKGWHRLPGQAKEINQRLSPYTRLKKPGQI